MERFDGMELVILAGALCLVIPFLGKYMANVFSGPSPFLKKIFGWLENAIFRFTGVDSSIEMNWKTYAKSLLFFNLIGVFFLFILIMSQSILPFNPQHFPGVSWPLALNMAISFTSNTDWQAYAGENTLSYLSQTLGLTTQNFLSASTGMGTLLCFIRGLQRRSTDLIGNFWVDLIRSVVYIFLPLSCIFSLILVSQGVIQNFEPYKKAALWETGTQTIPMGPAATQVAIKQIGSNGGGFFNTNSAHPFENPTQLSNFLQLLAIFAIPGATLYMFGSLIGAKKQGYILMGVIAGLWLTALSVALYSEWSPNPVLEYSPILEGKEARLGITNSVVWSIATSAASNGSVNAMLDSLSPMTGGMALLQIVSGGMILGGVGTGLCSMLMYIIFTVFLAGLMVGRSPEYLGKKIEKKEIQWALLAILIPCSLTLLGTCLAILTPSGIASIGNAGPHGLSEILYAAGSTAANNGSAFEGLKADSFFYNIFLSALMGLGRLSILIPSLALAGCFANKKCVAQSSGTFQTDTALFGFLLAAVILIIAALTFFPSLALGPIVEHILMMQGRSF